MALHWQNLTSLPAFALLTAALVGVWALVVWEFYTAHKRELRRRQRHERHRRQAQAWNFMLWAQRLLGLSKVQRLTDQRIRD